jgi:hypothetical protein
MILPEVFDYNGTENGKHTLFRYFLNDKQHDVTWNEARKAFHNAGKIVQDHVGSSVDTSRSIVAILAVSGEHRFTPPLTGSEPFVFSKTPAPTLASYVV